MASKFQHVVSFILNAQQNAGFKAVFSKAQQEFSRLGKEIQTLDRLQKDVSAYQTQQSAIEKTRERLEKLQERYALYDKAIAEATGPTAALELEQSKLEQRIGDTTATLERQNQRLTATGERLKEAGVNTADLSGKSQELSEKIQHLRAEQEKAAEGARTFGEKAAAGFSAAGDALAAAGIVEALGLIANETARNIKAAMEYETVMAGVRRTVGGSEESIAALGKNFRELSTDIPITTSELGQIAETAGQLGIAKSAVGDFTTVMAKLSTTTDLTSESAATLLAQFANITGTTDYQRLGSTVAELGDATATTASKVVEMSQGLAASATLAGMAETDILAISAAVGSLGIESQAGSTAMSTLISTLHKAVETGEGLADFAAVSNMSAAEFKTAWGEDAAGALDRFIQGLNDTERNGRSAVVILDELGITNVRQTKAILGLASAGDLLSGTIAQAGHAWAANTALQEKAGVMYGTTESRLKMLQNAYNSLRITLGEQFTPELRGIMDAGTQVLGAVEDFVSENPQLVKAVTAFSTVALGAAGAIMTVNAAVKAFKALDMAAAFTSVPGMAVMALGALAAVAAASWELADAGSEALDAWDALTDAHRDALQVYQDSAAAIDSEAENTLGLLSSLQELSGQSEKTAAEQEQIAEICQRLNAAVPNLSLSYDAQADSLEGLTGSLDDYIESLYQAQRREKDVGRLVELRGGIGETSAALAEATVKADELQAEFDRMAAEGSDVFSIQQELTAYKVRVAELTALLTEEQAEYDRLTSSVNDYRAAQREAEENTGALPAVLANTKAELELLAAAYNEAYEAAYGSISGQYELWDKAAKVSAASVGSINAALDSQADYWKKYNDNLQALADRSAGIEGLGELIGSFADGSSSSVNAAAGMARATDKELKAMVQKWQDLQAQQEQTSQTLALVAADVPGQMEELTKAVASGVEGMAMPETSAESARETIQAFIDQANSMTPWVRSAYAGLGQTAADALGLDLSRRYEPLTGSERRERGYASGTRNAAPGYAWVGENGPEIVLFGGGEQVLTAAESAAISGSNIQEAQPLQALPLPAAASTSPIQLVFHVDGGASPEAVESIREYVESRDFEERVRDVFDMAQADARRRTMI